MGRLRFLIKGFGGRTVGFQPSGAGIRRVPAAVSITRPRRPGQAPVDRVVQFGGRGSGSRTPSSLAYPAASRPSDTIGSVTNGPAAGRPEVVVHARCCTGRAPRGPSKERGYKARLVGGIMKVRSGPPDHANRGWAGRSPPRPAPPGLPALAQGISGKAAWARPTPAIISFRFTQLPPFEPGSRPGARADWRRHVRARSLGEKSQPR